jgi:hypothetical protein
MYKLSSSYAASGGAPVDLSDATISKLSSKLQAMKDLKVGLLLSIFPLFGGGGQGQ